MRFEIGKAVEVIRQTPYVLARLLEDLSSEWVGSRDNQNNWGPYDVIGHLIHGEETDWIPRAEIILFQKNDRRFEPFDRLAQFRKVRSPSIEDL